MMIIEESRQRGTLLLGVFGDTSQKHPKDVFGDTSQKHPKDVFGDRLEKVCIFIIILRLHTALWKI